MDRLRQQFYHINDDLLVKYLLGEATPLEIEAVELWINKEAANKKHYEDFKKLWDDSSSLALKSTVNEEAAWLRFKNRVGTPLKAPPVKSAYSLSWFRIAALFILTVGGAYLAYRALRDEEVENRFISSKQSPLADTLTDGSIVTLNKNTSLQYPSRFTGNTRTVTLNGEAFFDVKPDKKKPFVINVQDLSITVVGTSFNVSSNKGTTEVIVETGLVQVRKNDRMVELGAGESIRVSESDSLMFKEKVADKLYNYYRSREFVCDDTPLWKLVEVLNAAYNTNIIIADDTLRNLKLNTTFNNESLDKILSVVSDTFGIKVLKEEGRIILKSNN